MCGRVKDKTSHLYPVPYNYGGFLCLLMGSTVLTGWRSNISTEAKTTGRGSFAQASMEQACNVALSPEVNAKVDLLTSHIISGIWGEEGLGTRVLVML